MRSIKFVLTAIILIILLISGCQKTPSEHVVGNKQSNIVDSVQSAQEQNSSESPHSSVQDTIQKTIDIGNPKITVSMDAKVVNPDTEKYPVVKIETQDFTQEQADKIIGVLFSGRTLYQPWGTTKSDIESQIVHLKEIISDPYSTDDERGQAQSELEFKENQYQKAPDKVEKSLLLLALLQ